MNLDWSANLAYAVGLIASDGNLSKDGRHIDLTSKDLDQLANFNRILGLDVKVSRKTSSTSSNLCYCLRFSNVKLYRFFLAIGLTPCKSKTIGILLIPDKYFHDFLRGSLDGDGYTNSYWDPRWKSSFMLYLGFTSASFNHLYWLQSKIKQMYRIEGKITPHGATYHLRFSKYSAIALITKMYEDKDSVYLKRKYFKIQAALSIIQQQAGMLKLVNRPP